MKQKLLLAIALAAAPMIFAAQPNITRQQIVTPEYLKPAGSRTFSIDYVGKIPSVPAGVKKLRVWLPVPQDSTVQTIRDLKFSQTPTQLTTEAKYGNRIAYFEFENPGAAPEITMSFVCERREVQLDLARLGEDSRENGGDFSVFLNPDKLVLVDDEMRQLAKKVTADKATTLDKARAIYDYTLEKMTYDKNHVGWGLGSTKHACEVGKGNCTDFHALFNSLCRASGIPSGYEIGLYLPYNKASQEPLSGYHCWAYFRVPGKSWVPVDCSEADRFNERREYFFGAHTSNRVTLSTGRDITLEPKQSAEPLNYFLNPHAEADGVSLKTEKTWSFRDL